MRTTENVSLRLDPEVVRLARRSAEERRQTLREFFEEGLRRQVAAVTEPEERVNLLSTVEEAFLQRMDKRLHDVLERVAALSAKEATDQAHTLQIVKRVLFMAIGDQKKTHSSIDQAWQEAVERVRSRGRSYSPEVANEVESKLAAAEKTVADLTEQLSKAQSDAQRHWQEVNRLRSESGNQISIIDGLRRDVAELEARLERELWVTKQLEAQSGLQFRRKTASELRAEYVKR